MKNKTTIKKERDLIKLLLLCLLQITIVYSQGSLAFENNRVALVIGNADYQIAPLNNSINDSRAIAQKLKSIGFEVLERSNLSFFDFKQSIQEFKRQLSSSQNSVGLFYYAGHAVQVDAVNFLIPINEEINSIDKLKTKGININTILSTMENSSSTNILILDACRNNPFKDQQSIKVGSRSLPIERGLKIAYSGLAPLKAPSGTYIAYATDPGQVALDGEGVNGTYTKYLLDYIDMPGLPAEAIFKMVRGSVIDETNGKQIPWEHSSLTEDFYFNNPVTDIIAKATSNLEDNDLGSAYRLAKKALTLAQNSKDKLQAKELINSIKKKLGYHE
ncbi:MAG: caspase family protein [Reichenbachiella sp.]